MEWMNKIGAGNFERNMLVQSEFRGLQCGVKYAEAFISVNTYPRGRVFSLLPQYV